MMGGDQQPAARGGSPGAPDVRAYAALALLLGAGLVGAYTLRLVAPEGAPPPPGADVGLRIDPNTATQAELALLPGVGPTLAENIRAARRARRFRTVEDLDAVPRIGPKTIERLRPALNLPGVRAADAPQAAP